MEHMISLYDDRHGQSVKEQHGSREYRGSNFEVEGDTKSDVHEELHNSLSGYTGGNDYRVQCKHGELQMESYYDDHVKGTLLGNEYTPPSTQPRPPGWYGDRPDREATCRRGSGRTLSATLTASRTMEEALCRAQECRRRRNARI